jgi:Domain of unknown function (DUF932)
MPTTISILSEDERKAADQQAAGINDTYSLAGADDQLAEAGKAASVALSRFDQAEYSQAEQERMLAAAQTAAQRDAADRLAAARADQAGRASFLGGLAISGPLDVTADTDLDELAAGDKLGLPWHLRFTGPTGTGVTMVRKRWSWEDALRAAKIGGWGVRAVASRFDDPEVGAGVTEEYRTIVRRALPSYAVDCRCGAYHARTGEARGTIDLPDGGQVAQPDCAWLAPAAIGQCKTGWSADLQVEDLGEIAATLTDDGQVIPDSLGWLAGGTHVFLQVRLADTAYVLGRDPFDVYICFNNSYSGGHAATVWTGAVRVNCRNTRRWGERTASALARVTHVGDVKGKLLDAAQLILDAQGYVRREQAAAERLAAVDLTLRDYERMAEALFEDHTASDRAAKALQTRRDEFVGHLLTDSTLEPDLRRTGYGAREATLRWFGELSPTLGRSHTARFSATYDQRGTAVSAARKVSKIALEVGGKRSRVTGGKRSA